MKRKNLPFDTAAFLVDISTLDWVERGKYITLIAMMHQHGRLYESTVSFVVGSLGKNLKNRFVTDENGMLYHPGIESALNKVALLIDNGSKGGRPKAQAQKKEKVRQVLKVKLPFEGERFAELWSIWKEYKHREHGFKYKSPHSEQMALISLSKLSDGLEDKAIQIIEQSISNRWKGLFKLNEQTNGSKQKSIEDRFAEINSIVDSITG